MRWILKIGLFLLILFTGTFCNDTTKPGATEFELDNMKIRIAELKIDTNYLEEYLTILKKEAEASVRLEKGVLCIFPMYQQENPTEIRLLEIYANEAAYQSHLKTPHFLHYKTTTQKMVQSLKLVDMAAIDKETMGKIFAKLNQ